jgi:hypothetical protein
MARLLCEHCIAWMRAGQPLLITHDRSRQGSEIAEEGLRSGPFATTPRSRDTLTSMHCTLLMATTLALLLPTLSGSAVAQQDPAKVDGKVDTKDGGIVPPKYPGQAIPKPKPYVVQTGKGKGDVPGEKGKLSGKGALALNASCDPVEVHAGDRGTIVVVLAPSGEKLLLNPPPVNFLFAPQQGAITLTGQPEFRPSKAGPKSKAMKGLTVYEDCAILDIPFTVAEKATPGLHHVDLAFRYELIAYAGGGVLGPFTDSVGIDVKVVGTKIDAPIEAGPTPEGKPRASTTSPTVFTTDDKAPVSADNSSAPPPAVEPFSWLLPGVTLVVVVLAGLLLLSSRATARSR